MASMRLGSPFNIKNGRRHSWKINPKRFGSWDDAYQWKKELQYSTRSGATPWSICTDPHTHTHTHTHRPPPPPHTHTHTHCLIYLHCSGFRELRGKVILTTYCIEILGMHGHMFIPPPSPPDSFTYVIRYGFISIHVVLRRDVTKAERDSPARIRRTLMFTARLFSAPPLTGLNTKTIGAQRSCSGKLNHFMSNIRHCTTPPPPPLYNDPLTLGDYSLWCPVKTLSFLWSISFVISGCHKAI